MDLMLDQVFCHTQLGIFVLGMNSRHRYRARLDNWTGLVNSIPSRNSELFPK